MAARKRHGPPVDVREHIAGFREAALLSSMLRVGADADAARERAFIARVRGGQAVTVRAYELPEGLLAGDGNDTVTVGADGMIRMFSDQEG